MKANLPENEAKRIKALREYNILDTPDEQVFDDLTRLASYICGTPIALVSLIDTNRQWFKSKQGLEALETPRDLAFCAHAILQSDVFIVPNATDDDRFATNPLVTDDPHIRFYAGVPLINPEGQALGTLCVIDRVPRNLTPEQLEALRILGRAVIKQMELRRNLANLTLINTEQTKVNKKRRGFFKRIAIGFGLASAILIAIGVVSYRSIEELIYTSQQVEQSHEILENLESVLSNLTYAETGQRGYILTGNESYLEPYNTAIPGLNQNIENLKKLTADNPEQQNKLEILKPLIGKRIDLLSEIVRLRKERGFEAALAEIQTNQSRSLMNEVRSLIEEMEKQERALLNQRKIAASAIAHKSISIFLIAIFSSFAILAAVYYVIYREINERKQVEESLKQERNFISAVIDTASALVVVFNPQGQILRFNQACEQTTGYSFNEVRGRCVWDLFLIPEEVEVVRGFLRELLTGKSRNQYESYWVTKDGDRRLIEWSNTVILDNEGAVEYIISTGIDRTERKHAEELLRDSEEKYRSVVNNIKEVIFQTDPTGLWTFLNPTWTEITGFSVNESIGINFLDYIYPEDRQRNLEIFQSLIQRQNEYYRYEVRYLTKDGGFRWMEAFVHLALDDDRSIIGTYGTLDDITDRRRTEEALRLSQERYELAISAGDIGVWDWDILTNDVYIDPTIKAALGFTELDIPNTLDGWLSLVHPDDLQLVLDATKLHLSGETAQYEIEHRRLHKNGSIRWFVSRGTAFQDAEGNMCRMTGTDTDITARKLIEEALEREQQQLKQIIAIAPVAMAMLDREMRYVAHSNKWLTDYGLEGKSIIGRSHYDIFPDIPERLLTICQRALQGEAFSNPEDVFDLEDGSKIYLRWAVHPWRNPEGEVGGIVMVTDVINELVEARETALQASRFKSQFLANMSHEIRTPMNAVLGMTGLLLETPLDSEQQDFVETIRISGDALLSLINEILDLSKLEAGEMELEILNFDLSACIEEVLDLLAPQAHAKGLEIAALVFRNVPNHLQGDAGRLRQIIMNLTGNAIKFTSSGEVVIRAELQSENATTATIYFSVTDTGIGIPLEEQHKLFAPFTQVDASTTRKYGGTGLGLAICKQLVNLMGGEIGIESQLGKGSKFWFTVSFTKQIQPTLPVKDISYLAGLRLLIVDDNATNRKVITHIATRWGMQIDEADSAAVALQFLQVASEGGKLYDFALIDMQMPEIDGLTLGKLIKDNPALASLPLIMLTSTNQRHEIQQALNIGFAAYLVKPVKVSRLLDTIISILETQSEPVEEETLENVEQNYQSSTSKHKLRILLAEDNLVNQKVALKQLSNLGYCADVAANGEEVLQLLEKVPYDLIFMDCQMPVLDGFEATREIRRRQEISRFIGHNPVVIAMTANAMKEDREKCLNAGMDDYLSKPVSKEKLVSVLQRWSELISKEENANLPKEAVFNNHEILLEINWEQLHEISENNEEFELELLQMFVENAQLQIEELKNAIATHNFEQIERKAHHLKGSSANIGITAMYQTATKLEELVRQQHMEGAAELVSELEKSLSSIEAFLITKQTNNISS